MSQAPASVRRGRPAFVLLTALAVAGGCGNSSSVATPGVASAPATDTSRPPLLTDITAAAGLAPPGDAWPDGSYFFPEIMGSGVALFDFDGDGDLDILQVRMPPPGRSQTPAPNRLLRQQPDGSFVDVTDASGLGDPGIGQGVAIGDVDDDGHPDVYVTNYGPDAFYRNNGDGTFSEQTARAGFSGDHWSTSASFCDYDGDGDLDLYVAHYLRFDFQGACLDDVGREDYCSPRSFSGEPDTLYRNEGHGTFRDVTEAAGLRLPDGGQRGKGLGVLCVDLTDDGRSDIYVANDGEPNQLWVNQGDGTFADEAILRGVAVNYSGVPEASMGLALGDVNGDGHEDLFMAHLGGESNTLYLGSEQLLFTDHSPSSRLSVVDLPYTGFGCSLLDIDHDLDLDLVVVNGRVYRANALPGAALGPFWNHYAEPNFLFENDGTGVFQEAGPRASALSGVLEVSRGLATGDIDNDGDVDLVVSNGDQTLRVLRNDAPPTGSHWLRVRALTGARDALGARLVLHAGGAALLRFALPGSSYLSSSDPRAHFGLGSLDTVEGLEVRWPDGRRELFAVPGVDREMVAIRGTGTSP